MKFILILTMLTSLSRFAQASEPCTKEKLGKFVGLDTVVAKIDEEGKLTAVKEVPCDPSEESTSKTNAEISLLPSAKLKSPMKIIGLGENGKVEASVSLAQEVMCGSGYRLCSHYTNKSSECSLDFPAKIFFPEKPAQKIKKINEAGRDSDLSESSWQKVNEIVKEKISTGFQCGYDFPKGKPGKPLERMVHRILVADKTTAHFAVVAMESEKRKNSDDIENQLFKTGKLKVIGIVPIGSDGPQAGSAFAFCASEKDKIKDLQEVKSLFAVKYGNHSLVRLDSSNDLYLYSFNEKAKLVSKIEASTGLAECD